MEAPQQVLLPSGPAFSEASSPRSVTGWLAGQPGGRIRSALAATAHRRQLTQAMLDKYLRPLPLHHVRDMLVQAGVLPARDEYIERIEPWLGEILVGRPAHHAALVRPYATWHVLRRARRRSRDLSFSVAITAISERTVAA